MMLLTLYFINILTVYLKIGIWIKCIKCKKQYLTDNRIMTFVITLLM